MPDNFIEDFRSALQQHGIAYAGQIVADGKLHRYRAEGDHADSAWYVLHPDAPQAGKFGCWKRQIKESWHFKNGKSVSPQEMQQFRRKWAEAEAQRAKEEAERHQRMAKRAEEFLKSSLRPSEKHAYLLKKEVQIYGTVREEEFGDLVFPLVDAAGKLWSYQTIDAQGDKLFMPGGRVEGCMYWVCDRADGPLVICEGYATGATIHEATTWAVCCALNCGNLLNVAKSLRDIHKNRTIIIAADNDRFTKRPATGEPWNPGIEKATEAANAIKAKLCVPEFPPDSLTGTDFNDLSRVDRHAVYQAFDKVTTDGLGQRIRIAELLDFVPSEDTNSVLGNRYLCRGGSCVVVGQTSAGKSSFGMQMAMMLALGGGFFGLKSSQGKPLKSLIVQAENDIGDTAEMFQGILLGAGLVHPDDPEAARETARILTDNLIIVRDQTHVGRNFPGYALKLCEIHKPDLFWVDPFLSFYGDDINDQQAMTNFLRGDLNPISERLGIIWMLLHHTGKPSKEAVKTQKSWSARDFAYMGGSKRI